MQDIPITSIDGIPAGRYLDKLIAEYVMDWTDIEDHEIGGPIGVPPDGRTKVATISRTVRDYSKTIYQAWFVVEHLSAMGYSITLTVSSGYWCDIVKDGERICSTHVMENPGLAICRTALKLAILRRK